LALRVRPVRGPMPSEGIQGDEWETYGVLETFLGDGNTGWPMAREDQGHGVAVVVVGVTAHRGARERRAQGEARQVGGVLGAMRYARGEEP